METDLSRVISCNCSHCYAKGLVLTFVPATQFKLLSGEDRLTSYKFNKERIDHLFCQTCGVESFARGTNKEGAPTVAINIRCLDGVELQDLSITEFNGKDL